MPRRRLAVHALYALALALMLVGTLDFDPYDDSLFFKRVAVNALDHGALAWNIDEGPVYGSTSQVFQWLAVVVAAVARDHYVLAIRVVSALCLLAAFLSLIAQTWRHDGGMAASLVGCTPAALYTIPSGMETALVLALLTGALWLITSERGRELPWALSPVAAVIVYLARPDALLLVAPALLVERWAQRGRSPLREAATMGALLIACLIALRLYYGTALPLPFYAKQGAFSPYDPYFRALCAEGKRTRFSAFLLAAAPLFALGARRLDRRNLTLLGSVVAFEAYHVAGTIDVMGMHGRFYVPALPLLALAAARAAREPRGPGARRQEALTVAGCAALFALLAWRGWLPGVGSPGAERVPAALYASCALFGLGVLLGASRPRARELLCPGLLAIGGAAVALSHAPRIRALRDDDAYLTAFAEHVTVFRGLDTLLGCFGPRLHVYHSEVGVPGLRFQAGKVTDLAGLLSPQWLFRSHGFDEACNRDRPEAIFLPHKNYRALNTEILSGSCISGYERVVERSSSPLYVRKDLLARYLACEQAR